ncbi:hypothetical protein [Thermogemmatispora sp.]|uniref:hypothetical protein n=1 Tax=Thermogemmatispora sp. TaxID=1968838 RepID=UPI0035E4146C
MLRKIILIAVLVGLPFNLLAGGLSLLNPEQEPGFFLSFLLLFTAALLAYGLALTLVLILLTQRLVANWRLVLAGQTRRLAVSRQRRRLLLALFAQRIGLIAFILLIAIVLHFLLNHEAAIGFETTVSVVMLLLPTIVFVIMLSESVLRPSLSTAASDSSSPAGPPGEPEH